MTRRAPRHAAAQPEPPAKPRRRPRVEWVAWGHWWLAPLIVIGSVVTLLLASSLVPYQPFLLYGYTVEPDVVCAGGSVRAVVDREFTDDFSFMRLSETWLTVEVPGFPPDRPIQGETAELPAGALHVSPRSTVTSPLLREAPSLPGVYRVQIITQQQGQRWGFFPAIGSSTQFSNDTTTVIPCPPPNGGS